MKWDVGLCRVCMVSDTENIDLLVKVDLKYGCTYLDIFNSCTHLDAGLADNLPKAICGNCCRDLLSFFTFLCKARSSDRILKKCISDTACFNESDNETSDFNVNNVLESNNLSEFEEDSQETSNIYVEPAIDNIFEVVEYNTVHHHETDEETIKSDEANNNTQLEVDFVKYDSLSVETTFLHQEQEYSANENLIEGEFTACAICEKVLKRSSLKYHYRRCHRKERKYLCTACPKTFTVPNDLRIHMEIHDATRPRDFVCSTCGKGFFKKQSLNVHIMRHKGIKEHQCGTCDKKFTTKKSLDVHEFTHNRESGRYVCKYCTKRFPSNADLIVHERFHTGDCPYKCEMCGKGFAVKSHFNYHVARHKGVKYKCDQCEKEFLNRSSLHAHKFKHQDKMPFVCPVCDYGFISAYKLNNHLSCHTPELILATKVDSKPRTFNDTSD